MADKNKKRGLGKGLEALIPKSSLLKEEGEKIEDKAVFALDIEKIRPNPHQPRKDFSKEGIEELKKSISKHGVLQPILVTRDPKREGTFLIIAGERRWRACKELQLKTVPVMVKDFTDRDLLEVALVENLQREDLNVIEEGEAYRYLINTYNISTQELSDALGKSRSHVANILRVLGLESRVLEMIRDGKLTLGHGRALLSLKDDSQQYQWAEKIAKEDMTVRDVEKAMKAATSTKRKKTKRLIRKDPEIEAAEERLKAYLGTKVRIIQGKKKGKLEIEYYQPEDLERIIELLSLGE